MPKTTEKVTLDQDFRFQSDADLNAQIAAFRAAHEAANHQILAMDARRSLGAGKVRISFRVLPKKRSRSE
jgi:hypothetical protein